MGSRPNRTVAAFIVLALGSKNPRHHPHQGEMNPRVFQSNRLSLKTLPVRSKLTMKARSLRDAMLSANWRRLVIDDNGLSAGQKQQQIDRTRPLSSG